MRAKDLMGEQFGRLTVIQYAGSKKYKNNSRHGQFGTRIYRIWCGMKTRCYNKNHEAYQDYGGRGITVCDEWRRDFQNFYDWAMSNGYSDTLTIDRIDVDGNYNPDNCRWATMSEQRRNQRSKEKIIADREKGKKSKTEGQADGRVAY